MNLKTLFFFFSLAVMPALANCQTNYKNEFAFISDNDAYLGVGQDRYYTNGLFLGFRHAMKQDSLSARLSKKIWGLEFGQKMYNAQSGNIPDIIFVDRPFAAYLYGGAGMDWFFKSEQVLKATVQAGVIGPAALGEKAQKLLHNLAGFYRINGWQYQVNNEFEVNASVGYTKLLVRSAGKGFDMALSSYANAGTTFSGAGAGAMIRLGSLNGLPGSAIMDSRISNSSTDSIPKKEFFLYAQPMLNVIAYDATISGGMFIKDKGPVLYDPKPVVFSQQFGAMYAKDRWTFNFSVTFKTKEVKSFARPHQYGNISIFYKIR